MPNQSTYVPLGEVGSVETGFAFKSEDFAAFGYPVVRMSDLNNGAVDLDEVARVRNEAVTGLDRFQLKHGDYLFGLSGSLDAFGVFESNEIAYLNQRVGRLGHIEVSEASYRYLLYQLSSLSYYSFAYREAVGIAQLNISPKQVERFEVFLPSVCEQEKIAQILDTLDTQIRQTEALIAKLERIKQGLLTDLLSRGIDQNGQLRPTPDQAPHLYKDSALGRIPKEWDARKLCELAAKIIDGSHQTPTYTRSGVPFLRVTDIQSEFIDLEEVKFISQREHRQFMARCDPRKGDLLLSKNGTVGIAKIVDWDWEFSIFVSLALIRVREPQEIIPKFLETVLNSDIVRRQIEKRSKQGTVTNLHLEEIRDFDIPVPSEEEQEAIAQHANTYWSRLKVERHELEKLLMEKSGLMDNLLTGRVRVTSLINTKVRATA